MTCQFPILKFKIRKGQEDEEKVRKQVYSGHSATVDSV